MFLLHAWQPHSMCSLFLPHVTLFCWFGQQWSDAYCGLCLPLESMTPLGIESSFVNITTCLKSSLRTYIYVCSMVGKGWIWSMTPLTLSSRSSSQFRKVYTLSSKIELYLCMSALHFIKFGWWKLIFRHKP